MGIGFGLLAAPILVMIDTAFVPGAILVAIIPLTLSVSIGSFSQIDHRGAGLAVLGRVPGVVAGAIVAASVSDRSIAIGLGCVVLIAVAMSVWLPSVPVTPGRTVAAGTVSGFMGTTTGVGGPPMALLYQRTDPAVVRATLSAYFFAGTLMSIVALTIAGDIGVRQLRLALLLLPGVVLGVVASRSGEAPHRSVVPPEPARAVRRVRNRPDRETTVMSRGGRDRRPTASVMCGQWGAGG